MATPIIEQVVAELKELPLTLQQQVLDFTRGLSRVAPRGVPGDQLLRCAGVISADDARLMQTAIEQGCGQVAPHPTDSHSLMRLVSTGRCW